MASWPYASRESLAWTSEVSPPCPDSVASKSSTTSSGLQQPYFWTPELPRSSNSCPDLEPFELKFCYDFLQSSLQASYWCCVSEPWSRQAWVGAPVALSPWTVSPVHGSTHTCSLAPILALQEVSWSTLSCPSNGLLALSLVRLRRWWNDLFFIGRAPKCSD